MIDKNKLYRYYPEGLLERMKENMQKEYTAEDLLEKAEYPDLRENDPIFSKSQIIKDFKGLMKGLTGSQLPRKIELQLIILEDIIMNFLTPYTRQLLLDRILIRQVNNKVIDKYDSIEESLE